ncbi:MAG: WD40 repeat domain-containing protein [Phycisphaerae bacterium]
MGRGVPAIAVVAIVSLACGQMPVVVDATSPNASAATATTTASRPAAETATLRLVASIQKANPKGDSGITALAESFDGKLLAWGDLRGTVRLHSFEDNKTSTVLDLSDSDITDRRTVRDLAFDKEGQLWWVDVSRNIYRCALSQGKGTEIKKVAVAVETNVVSSNLLPWGVLSTDAKLAWPPKEYLRLFEVEVGKVHESDIVFPGQRGVNELVQHAIRSPDGKLLMVVADGDAALLSLPDMKILRRFGQGWGESAAFSPSSRLVALGTDGRGVFVWEAETGKAVKHIPLRRAAVIYSVAFVGEDVLYAADYPLRRIDLKTGTIDPVAKVNACVLLLSRSGDLLFVGTNEGGLEVYALPPMDVQPKQPTTLPTSPAAR